MLDQLVIIYASIRGDQMQGWINILLPYMYVNPHCFISYSTWMISYTLCLWLHWCSKIYSKIYALQGFLHIFPMKRGGGCRSFAILDTKVECFWSYSMYIWYSRVFDNDIDRQFGKTTRMKSLSPLWPLFVCIASTFICKIWHPDHIRDFNIRFSLYLGHLR